jgi:16S rRNA (cytosine1402-N4)-methyltransferase
MNDTVHIPVMLEECLDAFAVRSGGLYVDGTLGGGSHTASLLEKSAPKGKVWSLDVNPKALEAADERFAKEKKAKRWQGIEANFRRMDVVAQEHELPLVDGVLLDLGLSSDELKDPEKGLSFQIDGPLDMRLGPGSNEDGTTALDVVNRWTETELRELIQEIGEERFAGRIAKAIVTARKGNPIMRTLELADIIVAALPRSYEHGRIHPATRTFQAIRIAVNDELGALSSAIQAAWNILKVDGTLVIISFHSLEDRVVKFALREAQWKALTKRPLVPTDEERARNPRSRSAKLRAARKVAA